MRKNIVLVVTLAFCGGLLFTALAPGLASSQTIQKNPPAKIIDTRTPQIALLAPDLQIKKIYFAKFLDPNPQQIYTPITTDLKLGQKVFLVCELTNAGKGDSKGLWLLGFYIDDQMVWNNSWGDLAAGGNLRGVGSWTPNAEGIHNFRCVLDVNKQIAEANENNNQSEVLFKVVK